MNAPRITDEAVEAAQKAWSKAYWTTASPGRKDWMRAALEAALPHLEGDTTRYRLAWLSARRRARYASKAFFAEARAARELEEATPAINREALVALAAKWEAVHSTPAGFYPEASAHADGIDMGYQGAAEDLRDLIGGAS